MEIKSELKFERFNDGIVDIYTVDSANKLSDIKYGGLRYSDRTVGIKRFYAAAGAQMDITGVIRVPRLKSITTQDAAMIGDQRYKIIQAQHISDTNPPVTDLTLKQMGGLLAVKK